MLSKHTKRISNKNHGHWGGGEVQSVQEEIIIITKSQSKAIHHVLL